MRSALGKGLNALISAETVASVTAPVSSGDSPSGGSLLPIDRVRPNPNQPRRNFNQVALAELAASVKEKGILQPILVNAAEGGLYEIIAGERRWRAAQMAGLKEVPALIRGGTESERFQLALIENVQRQDLNAIEQAEGYRRLQQDFAMTQEQIAQAMGKDRAVIANTLRLLNLPEDIRQAVIDEKISMGHARALVSVEDSQAQKTLFERVLAESLPVRDVEQAVRAAKKTAAKTTPAPAAKSTEVRGLEEELQHALGRKVEVHPAATGDHRGWMRLEFYSLDDLETLVKTLKRPA